MNKLLYLIEYKLIWKTSLYAPSEETGAHGLSLANRQFVTLGGQGRFMSERLHTQLQIKYYSHTYRLIVIHLTSIAVVTC